MVRDDERSLKGRTSKLYSAIGLGCQFHFWRMTYNEATKENVMPHPKFFDRLLSNGTLAMIGAVALPVATGMCGNLAELITYVGPRGLVDIPAFLLHNGGEQLGRMAADGLRMLPEFMSAAAIGTLAVSTVEKISGRQLTNFSLIELAKSGKDRLSSDAPVRDASKRYEPYFHHDSPAPSGERPGEYVRPHMQHQVSAVGHPALRPDLGRDE